MIDPSRKDLNESASVTKLVYSKLYHSAGNNELLLAVVGSWVSVNLFFWGLNAVLYYSDSTGKPQWLLQYKVQQDKGAWTDKPKLRKALRVAINYTVIGNIPFGYIVYHLQKWMGCSFAIEDVPDLPNLVVQIAMIILSQEILFYYSHRMLHHPMLYKKFHKMHHEWTAPIGIVSIYAHPVEYLVSNGVSVLTGPLLFRCHLFVFLVWYACITFITIAHHSGYHLPFCPSPEFHDYHHLKFNSNYGTWGLMDYVHKTDWMFGDVIQKRRNKPLLGMKPISTAIPETPGKKRM